MIITQDGNKMTIEIDTAIEKLVANDSRFSLHEMTEQELTITATHIKWLKVHHEITASGDTPEERRTHTTKVSCDKCDQHLVVANCDVEDAIALMETGHEEAGFYCG